MIKTKIVKVLSLIAPVAAMAASLLSGWVDEQKMNEKIEEKVNEALAQRDEEETKEENK